MNSVQDASKTEKTDSVSGNTLEEKDILLAQVKVYESTIQRLKENSKQSSTLVEELRIKLEAAQSEVDNKDKLVNQYKDDIDKLTLELADLREIISKAEESQKGQGLTVAELRAELANSVLAAQRLEHTSQETIRNLTTELTKYKNESEAEIKKMTELLFEGHQQNAFLTKERDTLRADLESKTRQHDRLEEMVAISKSINENLKKEKESMSYKLQEEETRVSKLQSLLESANVEVQGNSVEFKKLSEEHQLILHQMDTMKAKLFHHLALSIKLDSMRKNERLTNISISNLWEDAKELPETEWYRFINDALHG